MGSLLGRGRNRGTQQVPKIPFPPGLPGMPYPPGLPGMPYPPGLPGMPYPPGLPGMPYVPGLPPGLMPPGLLMNIVGPPMKKSVSSPSMFNPTPGLPLLRPNTPGSPGLINKPYLPNKMQPPVWQCERLGSPFPSSPLGAALPSNVFPRPDCPNDLRINDFERIALLAGLDVAVVKQLWIEFQQLTHGKDFLSREQYQNIFVASLYNVAMQNLQMLAEETFRAFDQDKNGALDFFDFVSAYKANTPVTEDDKLSNKLSNYGV